MNDGIFEGNKWKHIDNDEVIASRGISHPPNSKRLTQAQAQERLDDLYGKGKITLQQWRDRFDLISEPSIRCYEAIVNNP